MSADNTDRNSPASPITRRAAVRTIMTCALGVVVAVESGCAVMVAGKVASTAAHTTGRAVFGGKKRRKKRRERRLARRQAREDAKAAERAETKRAEELAEAEEQQ